MSDEAKHTPEPRFIVELAERQKWLWEIRWTNGLGGFADAGRCYARCDNERDAQKIAAALNACAGIPTEQLERAHFAQIVGCALQISKDGPKAKPHPYASDIMHRRWKWFALLRTALAPFQKDSKS